MQANKSGFRVVPDTNVIVSSELAKSDTSPNKAFRQCWLDNQFSLLYSPDTQEEYVEKLLELGVEEKRIEALIESLIVLGELIEIAHYHLRHYPKDSDDTCFVLCADNGDATHLISYDTHLLDLQGKFKFQILKIVPFLQELREKLKSPFGL